MKRPALTGLTDDKGDLSYYDLKAKRYYIEENLAESQPQIFQDGAWKNVTIYEGTPAFVLELPLADPDNPGKYLKDIHIYPKNCTVDPGKEVSQPSINFGDRVKWRLYVDVPTDVENFTAYRVVDQLDRRLEFVPDSVDVILTANQQKMIKDVDYTISNLDNRFVVETTAAGRLKMSQAGGQMDVLFETVVRPNFMEDGHNLVHNSAVVEFNNEFYPDLDKPGKDPIIGVDPEEPIYPLVNVGELRIEKVDQKGQQLAGAAFQLKLQGQGDFIKLVVDPVAKTVKRVVTAGGLTDQERAAGQQLWSWIVRPYEEKISFNGDSQTVYTSYFDGLQTHKVVGGKKEALTYELFETVAPEGYQQLSDSVAVTFTEEAERHEDNLNAYIVKKEVINRERMKLPSTGSIVTAGIGGVGLILIAVIGLSRKSLKNKE